RSVTATLPARSRSDLGGGPKRLTGSKRAQVAEPMHLLDFERIERLIDLVVPMFANGRHGPPHAGWTLRKSTHLILGELTCAAKYGGRIRLRRLFQRRAPIGIFSAVCL